MSSQREHWITVLPDGRIRCHSENDGWAYMRKGPETYECVADQRITRRMVRDGDGGNRQDGAYQGWYHSHARLNMM
jgi:hypothetical protein